MYTDSDHITKETLMEYIAISNMYIMAVAINQAYLLNKIHVH